MAFTVEDGSRVVGANSYVDTPYADTYHADRGHTYWTNLQTPQKQACLIRATDHLQKRFSRRWKGVKVAWDQALDWPRLDIWDENRLLLCQSNQIPTKLMQATCEYALRAAIAGELLPDPVRMVPGQDFSQAQQTVPTEFQGGMVRHGDEKVDVIMDNKTYQTPDLMIGATKNKHTASGLVTEILLPEYPAADLLLEDFLKLNSRRLSRG